METSWNGGTPKSPILIGVSIINQPFWGSPFMETPISFVGRSRFIKRDIPQVIHRKWRLKGKSWTWNIWCSIKCSMDPINIPPLCQHCRWSPEDMINNLTGDLNGILNYGIYIFNPIYLYILFICYVIIYII